MPMLAPLTTAWPSTSRSNPMSSMIFRGHRTRFVGPALDDGELISTKACHSVDVFDARAQPIGHRQEKRIADGVTERIVDSFEIIEIDEEHGDPV